MSINKMLITLFIFGILGCQHTFDSTPRLLWKKEFQSEITSIAMSKDGKRIAITTKSNLYYLVPNNYGKILWKYEVKESKTGLNDVVMSNDKRYISCTEGDKILFLNSKGKLLWSHKAKGYPHFLSNNNIFIEPHTIGDGWPQDNCYLLNKDGKILWEKFTPPSEFEGYVNFSKDGECIIIGSCLYDKNGDLMWKLSENEKFHYELSSNLALTVKEKFSHDTGTEYCKLTMYDLKTKNKLWEKEAFGKWPFSVLVLSNKYLIGQHEDDENEYFISESKTAKVIFTFEFSRHGYSGLYSPVITQDEKYFIFSKWKCNPDFWKDPTKYKTEIHFYGIDGTLKWVLNLCGKKIDMEISGNNKYFAIGLYKSLYYYKNSKLIR